MPGIKVPTSIFIIKVNDWLHCAHCKLLLREAVQVDCGHRFCKSCIDELFGCKLEIQCPVCGEKLKEGYVDDAIRREISNLYVRCPCTENGCDWEGKFKEYEEHINRCKFATSFCIFCNEKTGSHKPSCPQLNLCSSGHVLTKLELQVLRELLATYSDGKGKGLLLPVVEQQDVSLEEVEGALRELGLTNLANHLKDDIVKGVENVKHYEAYEQALRDALVLTMKYLKFLFIGLPRSGKTSTRKRLLQEIVNLSEIGVTSKSTNVAETNDVLIKKLVSNAAAIVNSQWMPLKRSSHVVDAEHEDHDYLAQLFYYLISTSKEKPDRGTEVVNESPRSAVKANDPVPKEPMPKPAPQREEMTLEYSQDVMKKLSHLESAEIDLAFKHLTSILKSDSSEELQLLLKDLIMLNMIDAGGQPSFIEVLPTLTLGPALYMIFFRLDQHLKERYEVRFHASESNEETLLESSYCIEDFFYQALSSIACFGCYTATQQQTSESASRLQLSSGALLFGTHKDKVVDENQISTVESTLREGFQRTRLYREELLLRTGRNRLFYAIDNMNGKDSEMDDIRQDIEGIIDHLFDAIPVPASWLMFRIILHLLHKPVVSLAHCKEIAQRFSMSTPVQEALWFFHRNIGSLMYFPEIPSLRNTVICDPQVIFDSISELIIDTFKISNRKVPASAVDNFQEKGEFSLMHIKESTQYRLSGYLSLQQLIDLLKHLNVLAEIKPAPDCQLEPRYIMPAVLKYAPKGELTPMYSDSNYQACSLMIHFEFGFVPFGVFCATVAYLIGRQDSLSPKWSLHGAKLLKNKVTFIIDEAFFVTFIAHPQYLEIQVSQHPNADSDLSLGAVCSLARQTIVEILETVISNMSYKPYAKIKTALFHTDRLFDLAFKCSLEDSHSDHLMKVIVDGKSRRAQCLKQLLRMKLGKKHQMWFSDTAPSSVVHASGNGLKDGTTSRIDHPLGIGNLSCVMNAAWTARTEWKFLGIELGIDAITLKEIEVKYDNDPRDCFLGMLTLWLKNVVPKATWENLIQALRSPSVGLRDLADQLQSKMCL